MEDRERQHIGRILCINRTMKHKILAAISLITGLALSSMAAYYSVYGLAAIFPASHDEVIAMGIILEIAKLVGVSWLYHNWDDAPSNVKWPMTGSVLILMLITSMGIFGFLSKAHIDQSIKLSTGNNTRIESLNLQIQVREEAIAAIDQKTGNVNKAVDKLIEKGRVNEALKNNKEKVDPEKIRLTEELIPLKEEKIRLESEQKKVEAEFGPIKYVAQLFVNETDEKILDKAVRIVIIILILVFDPLAILLLLAFNISIQKKDYNMEFLDMGTRRKKRKEA
jgi:hypothetical protein